MLMDETFAKECLRKTGWFFVKGEKTEIAYRVKGGEKHVTLGVAFEDSAKTFLRGRGWTLYEGVKVGISGLSRVRCDGCREPRYPDEARELCPVCKLPSVGPRMARPSEPERPTAKASELTVSEAITVLQERGFVIDHPNADFPTNASTMGRIKSLEADIELRKRELAGLMHDLDQYRAGESPRVKDLEAEVSRLKDEVESKNRVIGGLRRELQGFPYRFQCLEGQLDGLKRAFVELKNDLGGFERKGSDNG